MVECLGGIEEVVSSNLIRSTIRRLAGMAGTIREGDRVRLFSHDRLRFMNAEFRQWVEENRDREFVVLSKVGPACRLSKVGFLVTEEFLERTGL